jgi:hypothetical protein
MGYRNARWRVFTLSQRLEPPPDLRRLIGSRHFGATDGSIMTRAIIVAALLLGGATGPLLVADNAFADHAVPDPIWPTVDSGADLVLSRPTFWDRACHPLGVTVTVTQPRPMGRFRSWRD